MGVNIEGEVVNQSYLPISNWSILVNVKRFFLPNLKLSNDHYLVPNLGNNTLNGQ